MKTPSRSIQYYIVAVVTYVVLSFFIPLSDTTREAYNLSLGQAHIIAFVTAIPLFGVWYAAFYCYGLLQRYAKSIHKAREGFAFKRLADGVMVLSWGLVVQAYASLILNGFANQFESFRGASIVIQNYTTLLFPLIAFTAIATGTRHLLSGKHNYASLPASRLLLVLFALVGAVYSYLVIHLRATQHGADALYLPDSLLLSTIIVPYLYAWFSGLIAAYDISLYAQVTHGFLYRHSLRLVSAGMVVLIVSSILMQYINSLFLGSAGDISLNAILIVDYLLLFSIAFGYIVMANGVKRLLKIEEI